MLVVTTENVAGHSVLELKRQCFGVVVRSRGLGGNVMAGLRSIVGGEIHEFRRAHPTTLVLKEREGRLVAERAADTPIDEPLVFDKAQTYTGDPTPLTASRTYQWIHSLPRILGALTPTGLVLDFVREHPWLPRSPFPMCISNSNGAYCLPKGVPPLPLAISLLAVRSRTART